jgi:hypothetical protein
MKRPIENNSSPGQAVYEPFSGSGTTIIAAKMTGRCCNAVELSPAYVDVAVRRWQEFTVRRQCWRAMAAPSWRLPMPALEARHDQDGPCPRVASEPSRRQPRRP